MAIYHLHAKAISRASGQSAVAAAAYRAGERLHDERTNEAKDYSRRRGVEFAGIFAPKDAPEWSRDRAALWNAVEKAETRSNSRLAREIEIALPHELTPEQRRYLVQDFIKENMTRKGLIADVAIHAPDRKGDERNHHAHILFTTRAITPDGFDKHKLRELDDKATLQHWRESWESHANRHLERWGYEERVSCKTLEAQGIDREATRKLGEAATHLERQGTHTERGDENRAIQSRNAERESLKREAEIINLEIEREKRRLAQERQREAPAPERKNALRFLPTDEATREKARELARQWEQNKEASRLSSRFKAPEARAPEARVIQEAWNGTRDAGAFKDALQEKGLHLARYEDGGFVAIGQNGFVHSLSIKTHGETGREIRASLNKASGEGLTLPTVEEARARLKEQRAQERQQREQERAQKAEERFQQERGKELDKTGGDIRLAYTLSASGQSFTEALKDRDIILARVSADEAAQSHRKAELAREIGNYAHEWRQGELMAVNLHGHAYPLTARTTGDTRADIESFLMTAKDGPLLTVEEARAQQERERQRKEEERQQHEQERAARENRRAAQLGATLYTRGGMESMQRDALRDQKERARLKAQAERRAQWEQERQQKKQERENQGQERPSATAKEDGPMTIKEKMKAAGLIVERTEQEKQEARDRAERLLKERREARALERDNPRERGGRERER